MLWKEATDNFLSYIELQRGYSINTADSYRRDLQQFAEMLDVIENENFKGVFTKANIRRYIYSLKDLNEKPRSIARKRSCLLSFGRYMMKKGIIDYNPVRLIAIPKLDQNIPAIITEPQMQELGEKYEKPSPETPQKPTSTRDKLIIELLYGSGIRVSELYHLRRHDIDWSNRLMRVKGKGNKERIVPVTDVAIDLLKKFIAETPSGNNWSYIFPRTTTKGRKETKDYNNLTPQRRDLHEKNTSLLTVRRIRQIVNRELETVSQAKKRSPHILRHSFASHLLDNGADIRVVKEMLGHSSLASTQVYTHVSIEKMLKSYRKAHPRSGE